MKIYRHSGSGHYIGSQVIVIAGSKKTAEKLIRNYLDAHGLPDEKLRIETRDIPSTGKIIHAVDGDY